VDNKKPVARPGPDLNAIVDREIFFDGSASSDPDGSVKTWLWIFGDGDTDTGAKVSHIYTAEGEYTASLTCVDNRGATDTEELIVTVIALPLVPSKGVDEGIGKDETNYLVDALSKTDTTVTLNTTNPVTVSVLLYPDNPHPEDPLPDDSLPTVVDVFVSSQESITWPIYVERHYTDDEVEGLNETRLVLYYYMDGEWHMCRETGSYPDQNIVWANMYEDEVIGVPTLIAQRPSLAAFQLSDLTIEPSSVEPGETATVTVTVTNVGTEGGTMNVTFMVDGVEEKMENVTLASLASAQLTYDVNKTEEKIYTIEVDGLAGDLEVRSLTPAEFRLSSLDISSMLVAPGEEMQGSVRVTNIGEKSGTYSVVVELDGAEVFTDSDSLEGGSSKVVTFVLSSDEVGSHDVEVDGLTTTFTVVAPPEPAEFQYSIVSIDPTEVEPGDTVNVDVEITNIGEESGTYEFDLMLDGEVVESPTGVLDGGAETLAFLTVSSEEEGTHTVQVNDDTETFTVTVPPEPQPGIPWLLIDAIIIVAVIVVLYYARQKQWI
jgi:PKD repeat protein